MAYLFILLFFCSVIITWFTHVSSVAIPVYKVREQEEEGTYIGGIIAQAGLDRKYDHETISKLRFRFNVKPPEDMNYVSVEEERGILRINKKIDREVICERKEHCFLEYDVVVSPAEYFDIIKVKIEITDLNDHAPKFPDSEITLRIPESTIVGTSFSVPSARDPDGGSNGVDFYQLESDSHNMFQMKVKDIAGGHVDVKLQLIDHLDREIRDRYHMKLIATDGGDPAKSGILDITVKVLDSNDNDPEFEFATYELSISENINIGQTITKVHATDKDTGLNGKIEYSLSSQTRQDVGHIFDIEPQSGEIFMKGPLDFEEGSMYVLAIEARDKGHGSLMSQTNLVVRVEDVNDKSPEISINTLSDSGVAEVKENSAIGTFVAHLSVTDEDTGQGGKFACNISSPYFDLLKMSEAEYKITTKIVFDREARHRYEFPIVCTDEGYPTQTSITNIVVRISDINDHTPRFDPDTYTVSVHENRPAGSHIATVNASDLDSGRNSRLVYKLAPAAQSYLRIDDSSGMITTAVLLDYEEIQFLDFLVYAEDRGETPKSASASVYLNVLDEDDERPHFDRDTYLFTIDEEQPPGTEIGIIKASDPDSKPLNKFLYSFENPRILSYTFNINQEHGIITSRKILDRERQPAYHLVAIARPVGNPSQSATCSIIVQLKDLNDKRPLFEFPVAGQNDTIHVSNQAQIGYRITKLKARDNDAGDNAKLMYKIVGGDPDKYFSMDSSNGNLYLYKTVTDLIGKKFALTLEVVDKGHPQLSDSSILYIEVNNAVEYSAVHKSGFTILASSVLTLILSCTAGALLVLILITVIAIVCIREHRRERQDIILNDVKETEKMLQSPEQQQQQQQQQSEMLVVDSNKGGLNGIPCIMKNNGVGVTSVIDMRESKVVGGHRNGNHYQSTAEFPYPNHHHTTDQNGTSKSNGFVKDYLTYGNQPPSDFHHRQYSRNTSPVNVVSENLNNHNRDYATNHTQFRNNAATLPKEYVNHHSTRTSAVSGEYVHYDAVDSDIL